MIMLDLAWVYRPCNHPAITWCGGGGGHPSTTENCQWGGKGLEKLKEEGDMVY